MLWLWSHNVCIYKGLCSSKGLPSVEHGRFDFPRPRPTLPLSLENTPGSRQQTGKGKEKEIAYDKDKDWVPSSDEEMSDIYEDDADDQAVLVNDPPVKNVSVILKLSIPLIQAHDIETPSETAKS